MATESEALDKILDLPYEVVYLEGISGGSIGKAKLTPRGKTILEAHLEVYIQSMLLEAVITELEQLVHTNPGLTLDRALERINQLKDTKGEKS